jgi:hypothetical protein
LVQLDEAGSGNGFVDIFDTSRNLIERFASQGTLNSSWSVSRASFAFGPFSGDILSRVYRLVPCGSG